MRPYDSAVTTKQVASGQTHPHHPKYSTAPALVVFNRCRCTTLPRQRRPGHGAAVTAMAASDGAAGRAAIDEAFRSYKKGFPDVRDISAAELNALQQDPAAELVLVDIRTPEEQQVSMLPGAVSQQTFEQRLAEQDKGALTVTYCTAGLRSGKYAAKLQREGFRDVRNLHGSLVSWAHAGLPLIGPDGQQVKRFHAYGPQWADMAEGSGYETVVHRQPLLWGVMDTVRSVWPFS